jgi:hypothetical protein
VASGGNLSISAGASATLMKVASTQGATMTESDRPWLDPTLTPRERAVGLVAAMTLEQKIEQLHGAMETIDIYSLAAKATTPE